MTGYTRKDTTNNIADGNVINAADLDNEFDGVQAAFVAATGHTHDGTASEGAPITKIGPVQDVVVSISSMSPKTTNTIDLGTSSLKYKDAYLAGNASVGGTLAVTGVATLTAQPVLSSLTASSAVATNASKGLVSVTNTGSGDNVLATSPTLVTPALGTPSALVGTNITGTASGLTAGNVTTNANLTGDVTSVGNATTLTNAPVIAKVLTGYVSGAGTVAATDSILQAIQKLNGNDATNANLTGAVTSVGNATSLGSFTSLQLNTALTDETGSGAAVFATSPTLVTPDLGTPSALVGTNITGTATNFTASNVTTNANLTGAVTSVGNASSLGSFTSLQLATALTDETGSGAAVFATSPTLVTPALGAATATSLVSSGTAASSFSVTSGSAVPLTITNAGTGNSFVVEDENSDASPFVIANNGTVITGYTSRVTAVNIVEAHSASGVNSSPAIGVYSWGTSATGGGLNLYKSRSGTVGTYSLVATGTQSSVRFQFDDGATFQQAASIIGSVEGTPALNSMPGRLTFSTTPDGSATPTERVRIDSAGNIGVSEAATAGTTLSIPKAQTGATSATTVSVRMNPLVDVTTNSTGYTTFALNGVGTSTTNFFHYTANQGTFSGTAPTNQYGFNASNALTGATNNYGFYSNIASGTNRFNFYAAGTAANLFAGVSQFAAGTAALPGITQISDLNTGIYFPTADTLGFTTGGTERVRIDSAGAVGIGTSAVAADTLRVGKTITGAGTSQAVYAVGAIQSDVTGAAIYFRTFANTAAAAFTLSEMSHFRAEQGTIGASSTVTNQIGYHVNSTLTGATSNYGFYSNIASGTNRFNFYANGTADNYFAGSVGIGTAPTAGLKVSIAGTASGATSTFGLFNAQTVDPAVSSVLHISFGAATTVSAGTLPDLRAYNVSQGTFTGTVTSQYAFFVQGTFVGATNNYGFYSNIAAASNRWNFYAAGTARNYMAADLTVNGATAIPAGGTAGAGLMVSTTANFGVFFGSGAPTLSAAKGSLYLRSDGTTVNDRMYVNTNGSTTWTNVVTSA